RARKMVQMDQLSPHRHQHQHPGLLRIRNSNAILRMTTVASAEVYLLTTLIELGPNAAPQARLEAAAERRLEGVGCRRLILIEAPSSTYHRGMLVVRKVPKKRRRPHALLHPTAPILLRHRPTCPHHGRLYPEPCRRDFGPP